MEACIASVPRAIVLLKEAHVISTKMKMVAAAMAVLFLGQDALAVAFKVHNQTDMSFRMRVKDRGQWRDWAQMNPGYWECPARSVKRTDHEVEIDVWAVPHGKSAPEWVAFHRGVHGSRFFTRIVHLYRDQSANVVMTWYDEPHGCRDKPVWNGQTTNHGCLIKSGWAERELPKIGKKILEGVLIVAAGA